jgi:hypothetical protein
MEVVNFCHISPVILEKCVEPSMEHDECGGRSREHREEPSWESPGCLISSPSIDWGVEVDDDQEVIGGVPIGVPGHPPLVHAFDPSGWAVVPVMAGDLDSDLSPILDIPVWQGCEWLLCDWGWSHCSCCLALFKEEMLHMIEVASPFHGKGQAVDKLAQELQVKVFVCSDNVLHRPQGHGPPLDLGDEGML